MLKKLFYLSGIVFFLSFGQLILLTACSDEDTLNSPTLPQGLVFKDPTFALTTNGKVYEVQKAGTNLYLWVHRPELDPPVPATDIREWSPTAFIRQNQDHWVAEILSPTETQWHNAGPPPAN